jgi:hypothetical protein
MIEITPRKTKSLLPGWKWLDGLATTAYTESGAAIEAATECQRVRWCRESAMQSMQQWKANYFRADGSRGLFYLEMPDEPEMADVMNAMLRWDTEHAYSIASVMPDESRSDQATRFFAINKISKCYLQLLDDVIDSSSDA